PLALLAWAACWSSLLITVLLPGFTVYSLECEAKATFLGLRIVRNERSGVSGGLFFFSSREIKVWPDLITILSILSLSRPVVCLAAAVVVAPIGSISVNSLTFIEPVHADI
ncbi:hypothetical protein CWC28_22160, partial [Pseudoalteromonas sp. S4492]